MVDFICVERSGNDYGISDLCRGSGGVFVDVQTMLEDTVLGRDSTSVVYTFIVLHMG